MQLVIVLLLSSWCTSLDVGQKERWEKGCKLEERIWFGFKHQTTTSPFCFPYVLSSEDEGSNSYISGSIAV